MGLPRKYRPGDPSYGGTEVVNSRPIPRPNQKIDFDVTPHGSVVALNTAYQTYRWDEVAANFPSGPQAVVPAMYYHNVGEELTFTARTIETVLVRPIVEWHWDFGDGTEAVGQVVTHTYQVVNPGIIVHLRATDDQGNVSYASMNLMLKPMPAAFNMLAVNGWEPLDPPSEYVALTSSSSRGLYLQDPTLVNYDSSIPQGKLQSRWMMDDLSGTGVPDSKGSVTGTVIDGSDTLDGAPVVKGQRRIDGIGYVADRHSYRFAETTGKMSLTVTQTATTVSPTFNQLSGYNSLAYVVNAFAAGPTNFNPNFLMSSETVRVYYSFPPAGVATYDPAKAVQLNWSPVPGAVEYHVYRTAIAGGDRLIAKLNAPTTTLLDTNLNQVAEQVFSYGPNHYTTVDFGDTYAFNGTTSFSVVFSIDGTDEELDSFNSESALDVNGSTWYPYKFKKVLEHYDETLDIGWRIYYDQGAHRMVFQRYGVTPGGSLPNDWTYDDVRVSGIRGTWVATFDGTTMSLKSTSNTSGLSTASTTVIPTGSTATLQMGNRFSGCIDDVQVYSPALTPTEETNVLTTWRQNSYDVPWSYGYVYKPSYGTYDKYKMTMKYNVGKTYFSDANYKDGAGPGNTSSAIMSAALQVSDDRKTHLMVVVEGDHNLGVQVVDYRDYSADRHSLTTWYWGNFSKEIDAQMIEPGILAPNLPYLSPGQGAWWWFDTTIPTQDFPKWVEGQDAWLVCKVANNTLKIEHWLTDPALGGSPLTHAVIHLEEGTWAAATFGGKKGLGFGWYQQYMNAGIKSVKVDTSYDGSDLPTFTPLRKPNIAVTLAPGIHNATNNPIIGWTSSPLNWFGQPNPTTISGTVFVDSADISSPMLHLFDAGIDMTGRSIQSGNVDNKCRLLKLSQGSYVYLPVVITGNSWYLDLGTEAVAGLLKIDLSFKIV